MACSFHFPNFGTDEMLLRRLRTSLAASRYFSADAAATLPKPLPSETAKQTSSPEGARKSAATAGGRDTLGRRLASLIYTKRSAVIALNKWKEEGHIVRKYEINRNVRLLRGLKRYKHALELCEWMKTQEDIKLLEGDYAVHLDLIAKLRGLNSAEKFFEDLPDQMKGPLTSNALLHNYVQHKDSSKAELLMEIMVDRGFAKSPLPYNHLTKLYISNGEFEKALKLIKKLKKNCSPDLLTYNLWLHLCASEDDVDTAEKVFLDLKKANIDPDWVTYSTLTNIYIKKSLHEKAAASLKDMEKKISRKVRIAYSSLISLHTSLENKNEVRRIWKKLKSTFRKLNDAEYTSMIYSLIKLKEFEEAEKVYNEWESVSPTKDSRIPNILISSYINKNQLELAENFHKRMVDKGIEPSYITWELLTLGYLKQNDMVKGIDCFKKALASVKKWNYNKKIVDEFFRVFQEHKNVEGAEQLLVILRRAGQLNTEIYNALLHTYAKASKMPLIISERMKEDKVELDDETRELVKLTSKMCISDVSSCVLV